MRKRISGFGQGLFVAGFAIALGLGARDAVAGVRPLERRDICEDKCWNKYRVCQQYNLGDCQRVIDTCLTNCAM